MTRLPKDRWLNHRHLVFSLTRQVARYSQPLWQSITWQDSWASIPYVWRYWPGKADATLARDWHDPNTLHPDMPTAQHARDPRQLCQGIDPAPHLTPFPPHTSTHPITLSTTEVNPDVDIHPTDTCELYITGTHAYSYTPTGRCTESLSPSRCQQLFRDFYPPSTATPFSEAVANLLQRYTRTHGHMDTERTLLDRPLLPTVLHTALVSTFNIQSEWLSTPLLHHPLVAQYASPHPQDAVFNAIPGCYLHRWSGAGLAQPHNNVPAIAKALRWAISSTYTSTPTLTLLVLPHLSAESGLCRLLRHPAVNTLCSFHLPKATAIATVSTWWNRPLTSPPRLSRTTILLIANPSGMTAFAPTNYHATLLLSQITELLPCVFMICTVQPI